MYVNSGYVHGAAVQWRATVEPVDGFSNPATVDVFSNPADGPETQFQQARPGSCTARATMQKARAKEEREAQAARQEALRLLALQVKQAENKPGFFRARK